MQNGRHFSRIGDEVVLDTAANQVTISKPRKLAERVAESVFCERTQAEAIFSKDTMFMVKQVVMEL